MIPTILEYDFILEKAKKILREPPYNSYVDNSNFARISIGGDNTIRIYWPETNSGYYNSCSIEEQSVTIPIHLMEMNEKELEYYFEEERRLQKKKNEKVARERKKLQEASEKETYEKLRAKYGKDA